MNALVVWLIALLVALPFGQVLQIGLGFITINSFELVQVAISVSLFAIIIRKGIRARFATPLLLFVAISALFVVGSAALLSVTVASAVKNLRFFLPFFVAALLLATPLRIEFRPFLRLLLVAALSSSTIALLLHHAFPEFIESSFSASQDVAEIVVQHGRLYWANGLIAFLVVASVFILRSWTYVQWIGLLLSLAALLNTASRTLSIGLLLFAICCGIVARKGAQGTERPFLAAASILIVATGLFVGLSIYDDRVADLIQLRYLGRGDLEAAYEQAALINRLVLYEQYWASLSAYFPAGQGLGRPIATDGQIDVFTTDISILSFLLPFGILGLVALVTYLSALRKMIDETHGAIPGCRNVKVISWLLLIFLVLISLNVDVFSRNNAVIWFTCLVIAAHSTRNRVVLRS